MWQRIKLICLAYLILKAIVLFNMDLYRSSGAMKHTVAYSDVEANLSLAKRFLCMFVAY